jgi:hypothetical protein
VPTAPAEAPVLISATTPQAVVEEQRLEAEERFRREAETQIPIPAVPEPLRRLCPTGFTFLLEHGLLKELVGDWDREIFLRKVSKFVQCTDRADQTALTLGKTMKHKVRMLNPFRSVSSFACLRLWSFQSSENRLVAVCGHLISGVHCDKNYCAEGGHYQYRGVEVGKRDDNCP